MPPSDLPPDSPMDAAWTAPADTKAQASACGPMKGDYADKGQIDASLPDRSAGHSVRAYTHEDQVDTAGIEDCTDMPQSFRRTSILEEKMNGGYTPNTAPVGQGTPASTPTPGMRGLEDTEALVRARTM